MTHRSPLSPTLPFGQFFGDFQSALELQGFALAHLTPTVPAREVVRHTHEEAHFVLLLEGTYVTTARGAPELCAEPTLIYNPPGTTHRDHFRSAGGRFFTISVAGPALRGAADCAALPEAALVLPRPLLALALRAARESAFADGVSSLVAEALCLEMLARTGEGSEGFDRERPASPGWLRRARELLRDACGEDLSIGDIAAIVGVHPVHLTRTFRRRFRCTPGEYLRRCRLEKAAALLAEGRKPLSEVALESGFADQSHLTKSFKQAFGVTPSAYRLSRRS